MSIVTNIKTLPRRVVRRVTGIGREQPGGGAPRPVTMQEAYRYFDDLAGKGQIDSVRFTRAGAVIALLDGRRFHFDADDATARLYTLPKTGDFEPAETAYLQSLIQPGWVCVDAGASFGWYALLMSQAAGKRGRVHAFEPLPHTADLLEANLDLNGCRAPRGNVIVNRVALAESAGTRQLFLPDLNVSGSLALHEFKSSYQSFDVTTTTLDEYCRATGLPRLDLLKADVEGAELSILRGGLATLARFRPVLLLEVQAGSTRLFGHEPAAVFELLAPLGYRPHHLTDRRELVPVPDVHAELPNYNFVFLPTPAAEAAA